MKFSLVFIALVVGFVTPLWAMVETDTHMYLVSSNSGIKVINRQTGNEQSIALPGAVSMKIHGHFGYFFRDITSDDDSGGDELYDLKIMDLRTHSFVKSSKVKSEQDVIAFYGDYGYLIHEDGNSLVVIDLKKHQLIKTYPVGREIENIVIHGDKAYLLSSLYSSYLFDLKTNTVEKALTQGGDEESSDDSSDDAGSGDEQRNDINGENMFIHGGNGYILSNAKHGIFVLDLKTNTLVTKISVGYHPKFMTFFGDKAYVLDLGNKIIVIDLLTNTVMTKIKLQSSPSRIEIRDEVGYLINNHSGTVAILDFRKDKVTKFVDLNKSGVVDFTHEHIYINNIKNRPLYPTKDLINTFIQKNMLGDFVALMPEDFNLGEIKPRLIPKNPTILDTLPNYIVGQQLKEFTDGASLLSLLVTLKNPKVVMNVRGVMLEIYATLFQAVWLDKDDKVKKMLTQLVQLKDPVITPLVKYHFKIDAGAEGSFKDALDEAPVKKTKVNDDES